MPVALKKGIIRLETLTLAPSEKDTKREQEAVVCHLSFAAYAFVGPQQTLDSRNRKSP